MATRKTEAEIKEEAERRAQDQLRQMGEAGAPYVTSSEEQRQEDEYELQKAEEIINDRHASSAVMKRLAQMEEMFTRQQALIEKVLAKAGFQEAAAPHIEEPAPIITPSAVPLDATVMIFIMEDGTGPAAREPVPVSVNGDTRLIPRGEYTYVTAAELGVLRDAVYEGYEYPVQNDVPLSVKRTLATMQVSQPVPYKRARFHLMVGPQGMVNFPSH